MKQYKQNTPETYFYSRGELQNQQLVLCSQAIKPNTEGYIQGITQVDKIVLMDQFVYWLATLTCPPPQEEMLPRTKKLDNSSDPLGVCSLINTMANTHTMFSFPYINEMENMAHCLCLGANVFPFILLCVLKYL